ncbi:MAG: hypothetical protein GY913_21350 [Proteobacteria bacterium]|nr:hypothetical protein [Pseudomonadota bacterium]MCP4919455.1 hypothetical protein [Pseudomonadota bacterium]
MNTELRDQLLHLLDEGMLGCVRADVGAHQVALYIMDGHVLAATSEQDDQNFLRRLIAAGHLEKGQVKHLAKLANGHTVGSTLWEVIEPPVCEQITFDRFRENLAAFLTGAGGATFEPMEALFVGHLQVGHDSRAMVGDLEVLLGRSAALRTHTGMATLVSPKTKPRKKGLLPVWHLLDSDTTVGQIVQSSPLEELATLDVLVEMMDAGNLMAQAVMEPEEFDEEELLAEIERATGPLPLMTEDPSAPLPDPELEETVDDPEQAEPELVLDREGFQRAPDVDVYEQELAMFADNDISRGAGEEGHFSKSVDELNAERVDLTFLEETADADVVEMPSAPEGASGVRMNFGGPALSNPDALAKITVANDVLIALSSAYDTQSSAGAGSAQVQLLLDGAPSEFAALFVGLEAASDGEAPPAAMLQNLRKRPATEHRRYLNRALADLIERAMNMGAENLDDEHVDAFLEKCVGYQARLGL